MDTIGLFIGKRSLVHSLLILISILTLYMTFEFILLWLLYCKYHCCCTINGIFVIFSYHASHLLSMNWMYLLT